MKKLLTFASALMLGIAANAAAVNWQSNAIQSSPDTAVAAGWLIQIYNSTVTFDYDAAKDGTITAWDSGATVAAGTSFRATGSGTQDNGTTESYYAVIYAASTVAAAKNYIVSDAVSVKINDAGSSGMLSFGAMTATTSANKFLNSSWTATAAVPEPTSGLLMLLGMAGLALRRRRA